MKQDLELEINDQLESIAPIKDSLSRRSLLVAGITAVAAFAFTPPTFSQSILNNSARPSFKFIPIQYIAALADPEARTGNNAQQWGLWPLDPGPRGVRLSNYERLSANGDIAPAEWKFDNSDWWLEEHGLIMEAPEFPMREGRFLVTGDREKKAMLTVHPMAADGSQNWELDNDASIYDVTHLRCRSARYTPNSEGGSCTPTKAKQSDFPVRPGAEMPRIKGCRKLDYMVLIIYAIAEENA